MAKNRNNVTPLEDIEAMADQASLAQATASTAHPAVVLNRVKDVIDKWRKDGKPYLFDDNDEVAAFYRAAVERILVAMLDCLETTVTTIAARIKLISEDEDIGGMSVHDLLRIAESMSSQISSLKSAQIKPAAKTNVSSADVEAKIKELEERRRARITYESSE